MVCPLLSEQPNAAKHVGAWLTQNSQQQYRRQKKLLSGKKEERTGKKNCYCLRWLCSTWHAESWSHLETLWTQLILPTATSNVHNTLAAKTVFPTILSIKFKKKTWFCHEAFIDQIYYIHQLLKFANYFTFFFLSLLDNHWGKIMFICRKWASSVAAWRNKSTSCN